MLLEAFDRLITHTRFRPLLFARLSRSNRTRRLGARTRILTQFSQRAHAQSSIIHLNVIFSPHQSAHTHKRIRPKGTGHEDLIVVHSRWIERERLEGPLEENRGDPNPRTRNDAIEVHNPPRIPVMSREASRAEDESV